MANKLKPDDEFYYNADGYVVLTEEYHLKRGYCCGNGCLHCPFDYKAVAEPKRTQLLAIRSNGKKQNEAGK